MNEIVNVTVRKDFSQSFRPFVFPEAATSVCGRTSNIDLACEFCRELMHDLNGARMAAALGHRVIGLV